MPRPAPDPVPPERPERPERPSATPAATASAARAGSAVPQAARAPEAAAREPSSERVGLAQSDGQRLSLWQKIKRSFQYGSQGGASD